MLKEDAKGKLHDETNGEFTGKDSMGDSGKHGGENGGREGGGENYEPGSKRKQGTHRVAELVDEVLSTHTPKRGQRRRFAAYRDIEGAEAELIKEKTGFDLNGYTHTLDSSAIEHIWNNHGPQGSGLQADDVYGKQIPLTVQEIKQIPEWTATAEQVEDAGEEKRDIDRVRYTKRFNGHLFVIAEVRTGTKEMAVTSMKKYEA